jgi:hypothetical protein
MLHNPEGLETAVLRQLHKQLTAAQAAAQAAGGSPQLTACINMAMSICIHMYYKTRLIRRLKEGGLKRTNSRAKGVKGGL